MTQHTVGVTPDYVKGANYGRKTITFLNISPGAHFIHLSKGAPGGLTITNSEYRIAAGTGYTFSVLFDGNDIKSAWSAVSDLAGAILEIDETSED
jgi:hypothetical protein